MTALAARDTRKTTRRLPLGWFGAVMIAVLVFAGQLKETPALAWVPVDLTVLSAAFLAVAVVVSRVRMGKISGRIAVPVVLFFLFLFGMANASLQGHSATKATILFTITLLLAGAPFYVLRTPEQRRVFLYTLVGIGLFTAASTLLTGSLANEYSNRLALEGVDTIGTAQMVGAAALICFLAIFRRGTAVIRRLILLAAVAVMIYVALSSGSRGPVIGVALALVGALFLSPGFRPYRGRATVILVIVGGVATWYAVNVGADGFTRIISLLSGEGDASTQARQSLWAEGWATIQQSPLGIGWGEYSSGVFTYPHNLIIEVGIEAGVIVSSLLVLYILVSLGRLAKLSKTIDMVPLLALLIFALFNAMVSSDINGNRLLWVMLSVAWVLAAPARADAEPKALRPTSRARASRLSIR